MTTRDHSSRYPAPTDRSVIFAYWQGVAEFERIYNFHTLRHTAITNVYRATKDLFLDLLPKRTLFDLAGFSEH